MVYIINLLLNGKEEKHVFLCGMHNMHRWHQKLISFSRKICIQEVTGESCDCVFGYIYNG